MSELKIVAERPRGETVRAGFQEYKGKRYFTVRQFYTDKTGEQLPTQKGVSIPESEYETFKKNMLEVLGLSEEGGTF